MNKFLLALMEKGGDNKENNEIAFYVNSKIILKIL